MDGARIANDLNAYIAANERLRMLGSKILVEPMGWNPSEILEVVYHGKTLRGVVKAAGPGCYPKIYNGAKGVRTGFRHSRRFRPLSIVVGDVVELGGLELRGYLFPTLLIDGVEHVICDENDVAFIWERE